MAERGRKAGFRMSDETARHYVYCFYDGAACLYVGKGTGRRISRQSKRFGKQGVILEYVEDERKVYEREQYWIEQLKPTENKNKGGGGGFSSLDPDMPPKQISHLVTKAEWKRARKKFTRDLSEIERVGSRVYVAGFLLRKIDESNCGAFGLSKVDVNRLREVANGPRC